MKKAEQKARETVFLLTYFKSFYQTSPKATLHSIQISQMSHPVDSNCRSNSKVQIFNHLKVKYSQLIIV